MKTPKSKTDRLGVSKLEHFFSSHGWLFREQYLHDYGIDAQVEIMQDNEASGKLIAIQVKSGESYFSDVKDSAYIYQTDDNHIAYWTQHCLPVIVVLYNPENDLLYWEVISNWKRFYLISFLGQNLKQTKMPI